ncbi:MAG: hypothetical protein MJE63_22600 [Proteobacteria bacterium]|nr:hypothetical protein [Pseudomonadota bacterium]
MAKKTVLGIVIYSLEKQLVDALSYPFSALALKSGVKISLDCPEKTDRIAIKDPVLFGSILNSAAELIEKMDNFELAIVADHSIEKLHEKLIRLNKETIQNDDTLLVSMLLYDGRPSNHIHNERRVLERSIDSFFESLTRNNIKWIRVHNSVIVYQDSMPVLNKLYICSYRYCVRVVDGGGYLAPAFDVVNQFTNFFQLFYSNPRALRGFGKRRSITAAVEIDKFLSSTTNSWDFYYFTGSLVSSIIDTFEKLKAKGANGFCLSGPSEHSLACGAVANWQLHQRPFVIVITSGMGDELKGTLTNLKQSKARGFVIVAEANPGSWFPFQGTNYDEDNIVNVMKARDLPVVSFTNPENMCENLTEAFHLYNTNDRPVVLLLSTKVLMSTEELKQPIVVPPVNKKIQYDEKNLDDIINILNNEPSRIVWRCGVLSQEEYHLVEQIAKRAGIVLVDGITRPGSVSRYKDKTIVKNYFGSFSLYGYSKKIYRYVTEKGKIRDKREQVLFFLKSKISQISSPFSEASLRNKFRIAQVNNNPAHIAPFADYYCQMNLIDFLERVKNRLDVSPDVLSFRKSTMDNTAVGKDTYSKSIAVQPMFPNYFFTELNKTIEYLVKNDNYTYTGIYDVGRNGVSAFRNIVRTGPGFSGWYGRALMGDALLAVNSLAVTSKNNILAFIGDGAKKMVPDIRANMIDNIIHQRKNLDINISIFYLANGFFSLINTFQESFLHNRARRQMSCTTFLEPAGTFEIENIRINQHIIEKYDHELFTTALGKKGEVNFFNVLLSHNNTGDGLSLASIKSYSWQEE